MGELYEAGGTITLSNGKSVVTAELESLYNRLIVGNMGGWSVQEMISLGWDVVAYKSPVPPKESLPQADGIYTYHDQDKRVFPFYVRANGEWAAYYAPNVKPIGRAESDLLNALGPDKLFPLKRQDNK